MKRAIVKFENMASDNYIDVFPMDLYFRLTLIGYHAYVVNETSKWPINGYKQVTHTPSQG